MLRRLIALTSSLLMLALAPNTAKSQDIDVIMALPAQTLTFTTVFVAEDMGFFKKEGLNVSFRNLVGVASPNAVLAGSAHFTFTTGPIFLRAASQGQRFYAIANMIERPMVEIVLRKDVAEKVGITEKMPLEERAKRMKGLTIAVQGIGSIVHAWQRYVAAKGGTRHRERCTRRQHGSAGHAARPREQADRRLHDFDAVHDAGRA